METFSDLSRVRLAKSSAGGSQNKEEKCKPGVCKKHTCATERLGSWTESASRHQKLFLPLYIYRFRIQTHSTRRCSAFPQWCLLNKPVRDWLQPRLNHCLYFNHLDLLRETHIGGFGRGWREIFGVGMVGWGQRWFMVLEHKTVCAWYFFIDVGNQRMFELSMKTEEKQVTHNFYLKH